MQLSSHGCEAVSKLPKLQCLEAAGGFMCDRGVKLLGRLTQLTSLSIAQNPRVTDASYVNLKFLALLEVLNISGTAMSAPTSGFLESMPRLTCMSMYGIQVSKGYRSTMNQSFPQLHLCGILAAS
jgi:hypothetical protein